MSWDKVEKDISKGPLGLYKWIVVGVVLLVLLIGTISWIAAPLEKIKERVVLKNSFQYKEGMEQRAAILEANIVEIDTMLSQYPERTEELLAQRRILNSQLRAITINQ